MVPLVERLSRRVWVVASQETVAWWADTWGLSSTTSAPVRPMVTGGQPGGMGIWKATVAAFATRGKSWLT